MATVYAAKNWAVAPVRVEKLCDLTLDLNLYPREKVDKDIIEVYARAEASGAVFPAIKIGLLGKDKVIVDGAHRVGSRKLLKIDFIDCMELPFSSAAELFAEAVRCNNEHGKAFSEVDVKSNIRRLQQFKFDVKDIQVLLHVPAGEIHRESAAPVSMRVEPEKIPLGTAEYVVDERAVVIQTMRVLKGRAKIPVWSVKFQIVYDGRRLPEGIEGTLKEILEDAGTRMGLLDYRPQHKGWFGTFSLVSFKLADGTELVQPIAPVEEAAAE